MEAKDMILTQKDILKLVGNLDAIEMASCQTVAQAQAEISFRAGIKEVEEWLDRVIERAFLIALAALPMYDDDAEWANNSANVLRNAWQAKRKELGIE